MEHTFLSESFHRENRTTFSEVPFIPEIFQWDEPKTCVPFSSQPEFPEFLGKWKTPLVYLAFRAKITPALQASIVKAVISIYRRGEEKPIERYKARISVTEDSTKQGIEKSEFQ